MGLRFEIDVYRIDLDRQIVRKGSGEGFTRHNVATPVRGGSEEKRVLTAIPQSAIYSMVTRLFIRFSHSS